MVILDAERLRIISQQLLSCAKPVRVPAHLGLQFAQRVIFNFLFCERLHQLLACLKLFEAAQLEAC